MLLIKTITEKHTTKILTRKEKARNSKVEEENHQYDKKVNNSREQSSKEIEILKKITEMWK